MAKNNNSHILTRRSLARRFLSRQRQDIYSMQIQKPPGDYPSTWSVGGVKNAYDQSHYLHSSIRGFNADYQYMSDATKTITLFDRLYKDQKEQTTRQIGVLTQLANKVKPTLGLKPNQDIMESDVCQLLYKGNSIYNQLRTDILKLKQASLQPKQEYLNSHNITRKEYQKQAAATMTRYLNDIQQLLAPVQAGEADPTPALRRINELQEFIQRVGTELQKNHTWITWKKEESFNNRDENLHSRLGFIWELILESAFADSVKEAVSQENIVKALTYQQNYNLSDLLVGKPVQLQLQGEDFRRNINAGISAKFRQSNAFTIRGNNASISIDEILNRYNLTKDQNELDTLAYIYDNYLALTIFDTESLPKNKQFDTKIKGKGASRRRHQYQRNETLQQWPSIFRQIFQKLADFVYLAIISGGLFGNKNDAGSGIATPVFDPNYTQHILDNLNNNGNYGIPAFLFTAQRAFETGKLLQAVFAKSENGGLSDASEVLFHSLLAPPAYSNVPNYLREIYFSKCDALLDASNQDKPTIYDILRTSNVIYGISDWHPLKSLLTRPRRIKIEFDPTKYL